MNRVGYCCISIGINEGKKKKDFITINRGMIKSTFEKKGLDYVSELVIMNLSDLLKVLDWNIKNNIYVYRMSSDMFPCIGFYDLKDLPNFDIISKKLENIGNFIKKNSIRTSLHPSHFNVLGSENKKVVDNTINELNKNAELLDLMGLEQSTFYPINIHVNTTKPSLEDASNRFIEGYELLSESCKKRLTLENDDSPNQYSVRLLYDLICSKINIPIVFDQHHFKFGPQDQTMEEALRLAHSTWKTRPMTHISSSRTIEDVSSRKIAHADYIYEKIETFGLVFDTEIEAKCKDLAVIKYNRDFVNRN